MAEQSRECKLNFTNPNLDKNPDFSLPKVSPEIDKSKIIEIAVLDEANKITSTITSLKQKVEEAEKYSYIDIKTGLLNGNALEKAKEKFNSEKTKNPLVVFSMDLNRLKLVNDTISYPAGDELLKKMALVLKSCFASGDDIYRAHGEGGDEFVVLCKPNTTENIIDKISTRLNTKTEEVNSNMDEKDIRCLSFAVGAVEFDPQKHTDLQAVIDEADKKMHENKDKMKLEDPSLKR